MARIHDLRTDVYSGPKQSQATPSDGIVGACNEQCPKCTNKCRMAKGHIENHQLPHIFGCGHEKVEDENEKKKKKKKK